MLQSVLQPSDAFTYIALNYEYLVRNETDTTQSLKQKKKPYYQNVKFYP